MPGSNSRPNVSEGYEVPLSYRGDRLSTCFYFTHYVLHIICDSTNESEVYCMIVSGSGKFIGYGLRIENGDKEDPHRRYLHHSLTSTRHRYSPESNNRGRPNNGGSREKVRGKLMELGPSLTT